jgi:hypothetical protein
MTSLEVPGASFTIRGDELTIDFEIAGKSLVLDQDAVAALVKYLVDQVTTLAECRSSFRIPVSNDVPLHISVTADRTQLEATPLNVSLNGVLVEIADDVELQVDQQVRVTIELSGSRTSLNGIVNRRSGIGYGISFPLVTETGSPPESLRAIVADLKSRWIEKINQKRASSNP